MAKVLLSVTSKSDIHHVWVCFFYLYLLQRLNYYLRFKNNFKVKYKALNEFDYFKFF